MPRIIRMTQGQEQNFSFLLPIKMEIEQDSSVVLSSTDQSLQGMGVSTTTLRTGQIGKARLSFSVLGVPVKTVTVQVEPERVLMPGGQAIGIAMYTDGVFVVDCAQVYLPDGSTRNPAQEAGLASGDSIISIDGKAISTMQQLTRIVKESTGDYLNLQYKRDGQICATRVAPVVDEEGVRRLGIWVRDSTAGIGTLSYSDPVEGKFGALGHAITDMDTAKILSVREGDVYQSQIIDVKKGERGSPGELHGVFTNGMPSLCSIEKNTEFGVYGRTAAPVVNPLYPQGLPVASQSMVHTGKASLLTTIDSSGVKEFSCRIIRLTPQAAPAARSMIIEIDDPALLNATGGIVQGMSGSPILQDGRIVGAVTHVYVNDPTKGYGIYMDWMLETQ